MRVVAGQLVDHQAFVTHWVDNVSVNFIKKSVGVDYMRFYSRFDPETGCNGNNCIILLAGFLFSASNILKILVAVSSFNMPFFNN